MSIKVRRDRHALALFDDTTGSKLRLSVGRYRYASAPELVDLKLTDYCPFACTFCYQDSTTSGAHASMDDVRRVIALLARARVFEVAIGGGEPTTHPEFIAVLREFRAAGIVPNFTTKALGWVARHWNQLDCVVGAFAYPCETAHDVMKAARSFRGVPRSRVNLHYVMGLEDEAGFVAFMRAAAEHQFRVTLLGYKTVGRGQDVTPHDYSSWLDLIQLLVAANVCPTFSIDTPLAAEYEHDLPIPRHQFHTREGFVSAYIDVVRMGMSASSFENQALVPLTSDRLERTFARLRTRDVCASDEG